MRLLILLLCAACTPSPRDAPREQAPVADERGAAPDPLARRVGALLAERKLAAARALLERERWFAADRARAALLLCGCRLAADDAAGAIDALRHYLAKTTRVKNPRDVIALRLLRHHAGGGSLKAASPEEACYFGIYALKALKEGETARPDLLWALREAQGPERALVQAIWQP